MIEYAIKVKLGILPDDVEAEDQIQYTDLN